jgi:hypothetical protein
VENCRERDHLGNLTVDGRLVVEWIIEKWDVSELDENAMVGFMIMMINLQVSYLQGISCLFLTYLMTPYQLHGSYSTRCKDDYEWQIGKDV